jgi:hypothetical protein
MQMFGIDDLPQTGEYGEVGADGELRVAVVESQPAQANAPPCCVAAAARSAGWAF